MSDTLFQLPEQKSPRLQWIEKYRIKIQLVGSCYYVWNQEDERQLRENYENPSDFHMGLYAPHVTGCDNTPDDALVDWARKNHVRLWNEESDQ